MMGGRNKRGGIKKCGMWGRGGKGKKIRTWER